MSQQVLTRHSRDVAIGVNGFIIIIVPHVLHFQTSVVVLTACIGLKTAIS